MFFFVFLCTTSYTEWFELWFSRVLPSFTGFFDGFTVFHKVGPGFFYVFEYKIWIFTSFTEFSFEGITDRFDCTS